MTKTRIAAIYSQATTNSTPLFFSSTLTALLPAMYDESGNAIDNDFITYYLTNYQYFDKYVKYQHGKKLYSYDEEEFDSALLGFKDEAEAILSVNINKWASWFSELTTKNKLILGNKIVRTEELGPTEKTIETDYGQDLTTNQYGAQSGSSVVAARHSENQHQDNSYELETLATKSKDIADSNGYTDTSSSQAHTDTSTRNSRTDTVSETTTTTENEIITTDNSRYYENMSNLPEFDNVIKRILNQVIIESGCCYEY